MNARLQTIPALRSAIEQWSALLGAEHVLCDVQSLARYGRSTSSHSTKPAAVIRPQSQEEVAGAVNIARACKTPLYPISRGKNWGYGDACAVRDGQVIVDLGRMNRIIEVDPVLAYAVIEPGVTQQQLSQYLLEHKIPLWMDCTGAGPDTSLIGNIVERGFGHSPYGNRFQTIAGMEVVLANGQILRTGFGHYPQAQTAHTYPHGVGPFLDGLFTQSNMGIVTRLGIWLMPQTEAINHFLCFIKGHEEIETVVDALRPLRLDGTLRSNLHIGNDMRLISGGRTYPLAQSCGRLPLPEDVREKLREDMGIGAWAASGAVYGTHKQLAATRSALRKALKPTGARLVFLTERKLRLGKAIAKLLGGSSLGRHLTQKMDMAGALFEMNRGIPSGRFLAGAYWRRKGGLPEGFPAGADPAADGCGMLWLSPVLPMRGSDVIRLNAVIEPLFKKFGFDLFITYSTINDRSLGAVMTITYDKQSGVETERAHQCYHALFDAVMAAGYIPYRVGIQSMAALDNGADIFWDAVKLIKAALDPEALIAPGRYDGAHPAAVTPY